MRIERRIAPADSKLAIFTSMSLAVVAALLVTSLLFAFYGANPLQAYIALFHEPFATLRGFGYTLVRTAPLTLIALGTIVSWRSGFGYLGFEGCFVLGAAASTWLGLFTGLSPWAFFPLVLLLSFTAGAFWAGVVALIRARFGGNEVLISLMMNYVAILIVQYLVSGPMRAPGGVPETSLLPRATWLPFILPGARAHAGDALSVLLLRNGGKEISNVAAKIGGDTLEPANCNRLPVHALTPASRLARPVARAPQDRREHVGMTVQHVRFGVAPLGNQANIFRHICVRGTCPLAIDNFMEVLRVLDVCR